MSLYPIINNNFATQTFTPSFGGGDVPIVYPYQLDDLPSPSTQTYKVGTLLAPSLANAGNYVIYNSTDQATVPFRAIYFDYEAPAPIDGVQTGFVQCAIVPRPGSWFWYSILNGAQAGTTDIDYLINTLKVATKTPYYQNDTIVDYKVQFTSPLGV